jgi:large subunit ribosomal protein L15
VAEKKERIGLHSLKPAPGSRTSRKRVGRGEGSGVGKTSGRGHKGAGQRSGNKRKRGYEGGQNPIHMRMAKLRGPNKKMSMPFENFRTRTQPVNLSDLEARFKAGDEVTPESLREAGLAKRRDPVKILARGELKLKLHVKAHGFSAAAREAIEKAGGTVEWIGGEPPKPAPPGSMEPPKEETPKEKTPKSKPPKDEAPKSKPPKDVDAPAAGGDEKASDAEDAGGEDPSSDGGEDASPEESE